MGAKNETATVCFCVCAVVETLCDYGLLKVTFDELVQLGPMIRWSKKNKIIRTQRGVSGSGGKSDWGPASIEGGSAGYPFVSILVSPSRGVHSFAWLIRGSIVSYIPAT